MLRQLRASSSKGAAAFGIIAGLSRLRRPLMEGLASVYARGGAFRSDLIPEVLHGFE
jgi:hypothetical protein